MKIGKAILIFAVFGVIGFSVWYFAIKKKDSKKVDANGDPVLPEPPLATPPIQQISGSNVLQSIDSGAGKAAIDRRVNEILSSNAWLPIQSKIRLDINVLNGVKGSKEAYYNQNISRPPISSAKNIPYNISDSAKDALAQFDGLDTSGNTDISQALRLLNVNLKDSLGTCFIGDPELANNYAFDREVICQGYADCGKNYKEMTPGKVKLGSSQVGQDMKKMSSAWLSGAQRFDSDVLTMAINDLRQVGWKFNGYDF